MKKILILLFIPILLCGCYNTNEINDLAIITMMGIDYKDEKYELSTGIINFKDDKEKMIIIKTNGKTIAESISNITKYYPKKVYLSDLKILLLSESILKEKAIDSINYLINYPGTGLNFYVITTENDIEEFLKTETPTDSVSSDSLVNALENGLINEMTTPLLTADMFLNDLISYTKSPLVPIINISDKSKLSDGDKLFSLDGSISINKENKLSKLNKDEVIGYNILKNGKSTSLTSECEGGKITIDLASVKTDIKYLTNNKFSINVSTKSDVSDYSCKMKRSIKTEEDIKLLISNLIKEKIDLVINKSIEDNTDFIGFGTIVYAKDYKFFKSTNNNYEKKYLNDITYDIKIDLKFSNTGNLRTNIKGSD